MQATDWGSVSGGAGGVAAPCYCMLLALPASPAGVVKIERISPPPLDLEVPLATSHECGRTFAYAPTSVGHDGRRQR
jgi:hypothetical protein